jgi:CubicO group peptidase (beta-lactamase class C family)
MRGKAFVLSLLGAAATTIAGLDAAAAADRDPLIELKRQQVEQAREQDLFFWERYLRRLESPAQFPQPDSFYVPSQLIEGRASAPLPRRAAPRRAIREQHWRSALRWATERDTEVLIVARGGEVEFEYYGPGRDSGSLLPVRSIAKSLAALAVGAAIADGSIRDVQRPVGDFLQPWRDDPRGRITLEQLLTMSSGLQAFSLDSSPTSLSIQLAEGSNVRDVALASPLVAEPGTRFGWGNVESQLLAHVVEAATGQSYRDYLQARIWKPLELGTASFNVDRDGRTRAFCCLRIRAEDLLRIGLMLLDGGDWQGRSVLPRDWVAQMFAPSAINPYHGYQSFIGWSVGGPRRADPPLIVRNEVPFSEPTWYLSGYGGTTTLWLMPCSGTAIIRFGNDPKEWETSANLLLTGSLDPRAAAGAPGRAPRAAAAAARWPALCNEGNRPR